jgi:outer membrane receptor protein involved in Fe transport
LANLSYQDLTARSFADSLRVLAYWNNQEQGTKFRFVPSELKFFDGDVLWGANIELGKFIGSHQLVYGVDYSRDRVESWGFGPNQQGIVGPMRGTEMNGSKYSMLGVYLQDRFDPWKWLTVVAGARYGRFTTSGDEVTIVGPISLDNRQSDFTGAVNLIAHVSPHVNVIANVFRGFRAPNLDDTSRFSLVLTPTFGFQIPNADVEAEHVMSYEGGVKFDRKGLSGSAFVFRNELTDLLAVGRIGFYDINQNGKKDGFDFDIFMNRNIGEAVIKGYELEARYATANGLSVWAHYAASDATDSLTGESLAFVPGGAGAAGVRYALEWKRRPWAELVWRHQAAQSDVQAPAQPIPGYAEGFNVLNVRGGFDVTDAISAMVGVQNVLDEEYRDIDQLTIQFGTGRQLVLGLAYNF